MIGTTLLNRYRIDAELGRGGMGVVYRGYDTTLDRPVAIKVVSQKGLGTEGRARLQREAKAAAQLNHPNIVGVYDAGEADGVPFIVMEFVRGDTLRDIGNPVPRGEAAPTALRAVAQGRPTILQTLDIARQLCEALAHAHQRGIVHRDLKPENVMIVSSGSQQTVKLMDMGLAHTHGAPRLTEEGTIVGTALYLAPEQALGDSVDGRADLYALGVILFELCTGRPPFVGHDLLSIVTQHLSAPIPEPSQLNPDIPPLLGAIIVKLLAKKPHLRFDSARELADALASVAAMLSAPTPQPTPQPLVQTQYLASPRAITEPPHAPDYEGWPLDPIPEPQPLIGRRAEINRYLGNLTQFQQAVIEGMAGVGKTTIGAYLARHQMQNGRQVFWVSFDPTGKNSTEALIWDFAAFLARDGKPELWQYLQRESQQQESTEARPRDRAKRFALILSALQRGRYTLCLDNFHVLIRDPELDPELAYFFAEIRKRLESRPNEPIAQFVIMAREVTPFLRNLSGGPLKGFVPDDAREFLAASDLRLPEPHFRTLHAKVEGNPQFLRLSLGGLKARQSDPQGLSHFIEGLAAQPNVRDFLIENLNLDGDEQRVLDALSVFTKPVPREAVEEMLIGENVSGLMRLFDRLAHGHAVVELQESQLLTLHVLVREYCYSRLDRAQRLRLHGRAAAYFAEGAQRDFIAASYHYRMARAYAEAAQILIAHAPALMRAGRLDAMLEQIAPLTREQVTPEHWTALCRVRGDALFRRGAYDQAIGAYQEALQNTTGARALAELYNRLGRCYQGRGRFTEAISHYQKQLRIGEAERDDEQMAEAQLGIGRVRARRGEYDAAVEHLRQAAALGERMGDDLMTARARGNLGLVHHERGELDQAIENHRRSLESFRRADRPELIAGAVGNLGRVYHDRGDYDNAAACYQQAIQIHESLSDVYYLSVDYNNLGELHLERRNYAEASANLQKSAEIAEQTGNDYVLAVACASLAESYLALGDFQQASACAARGLELARRVGVRQQEGVAHGKLGKVHAALNRRAEAQKEFETAEQILEQVGYKPELARAYQSHGEFLLGLPEAQASARARLEKARALYAELGSAREAQRISDILQTANNT